MEKQLQDYLYQHIPISRAMGVLVEHATTDKVVVCAPIANNINHKQTAFGGSLHAVATLACWSLLHMNLKATNEAIQIVVAKSDATYLAPVGTDFKAECVIPSNAEWHRFLKMLSAKGKGRIELSAQIYHEGKLAVNYQAVFAALREK